MTNRREEAPKPWPEVTPGARVRWTPNPRGLARGLAPVEGVFRDGGTPNRVRFARIGTAEGKVVQVWENQGDLVLRAGDAPDDATSAPVPPPPVRAGRRPTPPSRPALDTAGLARPPRATPDPSGHYPAGLLKALHSVETVLPRLGVEATYEPARALVAAVRRWIEGAGAKPAGLTEAAFDAMEARADDPVCHRVLLAVRALGQGRVEAAHVLARGLAQVLRAEAAGEDYAAGIAAVTHNPAYADHANPRLQLPPPPDRAAARAWTVARAAATEDGFTLRATDAEAPYVRSKTAEAWRDVRRGAGPAARRRYARELLTAKEGLLEAFAVARRSGFTKRPDHLWDRWYAAHEAITRYDELQQFEVAWASGLRDPASEAATRLRAKAAADAQPHLDTLRRVGPRVDAVLRALAADLAAQIEAGAAQYAATRARDRAMRVPQNADVAELARARLQAEVRDLADAGRWLFRFSTVLQLVEGEWVNYARPRPHGGADPLVPFTDAAYGAPTREAVRAAWTAPIAARALDALRAIGAADAEALVVASETVDALRESEGVQGPWWAAFHPTVSTLSEKWAGYATGRRALHPRFL